MTGKSAIVFDEVGFNVSQEVKNLIYSLDIDHSYGSQDEALMSRIRELEDRLAEEKAKNEDVRAELELCQERLDKALEFDEDVDEQ